MDEGILRPLFGLDGKVALVTGGGRGLGRSMALALAQAGADLALVSRTEAELDEVSQKVRGLGRKALSIVADLTNFDQIPAIVEKVVADYGHIDILVNNAGRNIRGPAENFSIQDWDAVMNINLRASFLMAQTVGRVMIRQGHGKIINTASLTSFIGFPNMIAYCASRGAVQQMTKALAVEWAKDGINVNAIAPGYFLTKQTQSVFDDPKRKEWVLSKIPMGRIGDLEKDLAGVVIFLASSASDYITGQTIIVDGGWMAG